MKAKQVLIYADWAVVQVVLVAVPQLRRSASSREQASSDLRVRVPSKKKKKVLVYT